MVQIFVHDFFLIFILIKGIYCQTSIIQQFNFLLFILIKCVKLQRGFGIYSQGRHQKNIYNRNFIQNHYKKIS